MTPIKTNKTKQRRISLAATAKWFFTALVWLFIVTLGVLAYFGTDLPDVEEVAARTRKPGITIVSAQGLTIATHGQLYGLPVEAQDMPPYLEAAITSTEDRRFRSHWGVDPWGILRAAYHNIRAGRVVQGGSTLTQQVAKNLFLTSERSYGRKIRELLLAFWLEHKFTKDQILTLYLNRVYLGKGTYGVEAAAKRYFGKSAKDLSLYQAAMIAGMLKAPSRYNPASGPDQAKARTAQVLANMVATGALTRSQAEAAKAEGPGWMPLSRARSGRHFTDWVLDRVSSYVGTPDRDLIVTTTLDLDLQRRAEEAFAALMDGPGKQANVGQGAVVVLDGNGAVRAMIGGTDYAETQFNRATQAMRQPGSAFKPFVYLTALEMGLSPDYKLLDQPITVKDWSPSNFSNRFQGEVTLTEAFAKSINTVAVTVQEMVHRERVIATARRLGIMTPLTEEPSLALGTSVVTPLDLTAAYVPFANGGRGIIPHAIQTIRDQEGNVLYSRSGGGLGEVISPAALASINAMLAAVVETGTGRAAAFGYPAGGKTGTSQDFRDAWFIGHSAGLTAGVWLGNDDDSPMKHVTGGGLPARLWRDIMRVVVQG